MSPHVCLVDGWKKKPSVSTGDLINTLFIDMKKECESDPFFSRDALGPFKCNDYPFDEERLI